MNEGILSLYMIVFLKMMDLKMDLSISPGKAAKI